MIELDTHPRQGWSTSRRLAAWAVATAAILMVPLVAMRFDSGVDWSPGDFVFATVLIFGSGLVYELSRRASGHRAYRAALAIALGAAFLTVWANGAVGIIGSEDNPLNLMFHAVLLVGLAGAVLAGARPGGLARAMVATAIAQLLAAVCAQLLGHFIWVYTAVMLGAWLLSARLFRQAAADAAGKPS